jgi:DNA-binding response OmpR family regulator
VSDPNAPSFGAGGGLRILVADDNEDAATSLATLLELSGYTVDIANDGEHALRLAHSTRPGVALLDLGMPKITGADVARAIRETEWGRLTVIIAITGWSIAESEKRGDRAVFDAYLLKPVEFDSLLSRIQSMSAAPKITPSKPA